MVSYLHTYLLTYNVDTRDPIGSEKTHNIYLFHSVALRKERGVKEGLHI